MQQAKAPTLKGQTPPNMIRDNAFLLWDLAGTLVRYDDVSGRLQALPGSLEYLPELARDFRMVVTTGDATASARGHLAAFELLPHLEDVFGDLAGPIGKPYGEILRGLRGDPSKSLAIGDRLTADVAADTDEIVTILINQDGDMVNAGVIAFLVAILRKHGDVFGESFTALCADAATDPEAVGTLYGGAVTEAWRRDDGLGYRLWRFEHPVLAGTRSIIVI